MADKCAICKNKIEKTFLGKINGTYIGKKTVCNNCQREHKNTLKEKL